MSETRPVYLVATTAGTIIGPYHAGCAERLVISKDRDLFGKAGESQDYVVYGSVPREETLPW